MDNDALMRRISAATDAKKAAARSTAPAAPAPVYVQKPNAAPEKSHMRTMMEARNSGQAQPQQAPIHHAQPVQRAPSQPPIQPQRPVQQAAPNTVHPVPQQQFAQPQPPQQQPLPQQTSAVQAPMPTSMQPSQVQSPQTMQPQHAQPAPSAPAPQLVDAGAPLMTFIPPTEDEGPKTDGPRPMRKEERPEAFIVACNGNIAIVQGNTSCVDTVTGLTWAVGRMLSIIVGKNRVVGMICDIKMPDGSFTPDGLSLLHFQVELQGEVQDDSKDGKPKFVKGITSYPGVGSVVHQIRAVDLASLYAATGNSNALIGHLSQDESIPALVDVPDMLSKHFAVLGSTGCGKSASVSLLLHAAQELIPDLRTIILDPHNEYTKAFPDSNTVEQSKLDLPFWMFQLEEYVEVLFRGKPIVHEEVDALREFIPDAKAKFRDGEDRVKLRSDGGSAAFTADSAVPYRMADLLSYVDDEMGLLESRFDKTVLKSLKARIQAHCNDARYAFMFRHKTIEDIASQIIHHFFCLPGGKSLNTIIQMAGMPAEVVNAVASVLCRLSFELAIAAKGYMKILVVCEEAHRYVPAGKGGFEPTRRAIGRIAKEGRKYGSFMAIISQRPSELDPTILSQCSTVFSLRLTNDFDQGIIKKAISSSSASTVAFISSLSNRECIAFGEGMSTPMRMRFRSLPKEWLPGADADVFGHNNPVTSLAQSQQVFQNWRQSA